MVGVGSGSALNAFNIGQQATQPTAVGMAIKSIVDNADKQGLLQAQSGAQTGGALATAQYKSQLESREQDVMVQNPDGSFTKVRGAPGGKKSILGMPQMTQLQKFGVEGSERPPVIDFSTGQPPVAPAAPVVDPGTAPPGGPIDLNNIDPNRELTAEEEAHIRAALGL